MAINSFSDLFSQWYSHKITADEYFSGLRIFWWMRIGTLLQFLGGLSVVVDLIGENRLKNIENFLYTQDINNIFRKFNSISDGVRFFILVVISYFGIYNIPTITEFLPLEIPKILELMFLIVIFSFFALILLVFYNICEMIILKYDKKGIYKKLILKNIVFPNFVKQRSNKNNDKGIITPLGIFLEIGYLVVAFYCFTIRKFSHNYEFYIAIILLVLSSAIIGLTYYILCKFAIFLIGIYQKITYKNNENNHYSIRSQFLLISLIFFILGSTIVFFAP